MNAPKPAQGESPLLTRRHLVVCIDDDPAVLSALRRLLRAEPYEFLSTDDPDEGMDLVRTRDVSLYHRRLPDAGDERHRSSPVGQVGIADSVRLLLTGYPRATWVLQAHERELMHLVIGKPWDNENLRRTILARLHDRELSESA